MQLPCLQRQEHSCKTRPDVRKKLREMRSMSGAISEWTEDCESCKAAEQSVKVNYL